MTANPKDAISSTFFSIGGTLPLDSPSYIRRKADGDLLEALKKQDYALVLDSRQKGKSSLIARCAHALRQQGVKVVKLDLQRFGTSLTAEQWYSTLLMETAAQLDDEPFARELLQQSPFPSLGQLWVHYLERRCLEEAVGLVVFVDEIDVVKSLHFDSDEFFGLIRSSFQQRVQNPELKKLSFCFCGASTPAGLVRNPSNGAMILGHRIQLMDFELEDLVPYSSVLGGATGKGDQVLRQVLAWTSGHPYLTQLACFEWTRGQRASVNEFFSSQLVEVGNQYQSDHLVSVSNALLNPSFPETTPEEARIRVLSALFKIYRRGRVKVASLSRDVLDYLTICGVIVERNGMVTPRNRIYREAFNRRWIREHLPNAEARRLRRVALKAFGTTAAVSLVILGLVGSLAIQNSRLAQGLEKALRKATTNERIARQEAYVGAMQSVSTEINDGNTMRAGLILESLRDSPFQDWEWRFASRALKQYDAELQVPELPISWFVDSRLNPIAFAYADRLEWVDSFGRMIRTVKYSGGPRALFKSGGKIVAAGDETTEIFASDGTREIVPGRVLSIAASARLVRPKGSDSVILYGSDGEVLSEPIQVEGSSAILSPDQRFALIWNRTEVKRIDFRSATTTLLCTTTTSFNDVELDAAKLRAYVASDEPEVLVIDVRDGRIFGKLTESNGPVRQMDLSNSLTQLLTCGADGRIRLYDARSQTLIRTFAGHKDRVQAIEFSSDDKSFMSGSYDATWKRWRCETPSTTSILGPTVAEGIARAKISLDSSAIAGGFPDRSVRRFVLERTGKVRSAAYVRTMGEVVTGANIGNDEFLFGTDKGEVIWGADRQTIFLPGAEGRSDLKQITATDLASPVYLAFGDGTVRSLNILRREVTPFRKSGNLLTASSQSADGEYLVFGFADGTIEKWSTRTGRLLRQWKFLSPVIRVQFDHDTDRFSVATNSGIISVVSSNDGQPIEFVGHKSRVWRADFSSDGKFLVSCSFDNSARIWDVNTGTLLHKIQLKSWVGDVGLNPSGTRLVTTCGDGTVRVWSVATGREVFLLHKDATPMFSARFSADGRWIYATNNRGNVFVWDGSPIK